MATENWGDDPVLRVIAMGPAASDEILALAEMWACAEAGTIAPVGFVE